MRVAVPTLVAILLAPVAAAAWSSQGVKEPDHPLDGGSMWEDPYTGPERRVYFNVVLTPASTKVNPNVAALGTRHAIVGAETPIAFFGVWKDCNTDGYMGLAEQGLLVYDNKLLLDDSTCGETVFWPGDPPQHNTKGTVHELLWIGWHANRAPTPDEFVTDIFDDPQARVWGDDGGPDEPYVPCQYRPGAGTFSGTGGLLAYLDCHGRRDIGDRGVREQLGMGSPDPTCSESLANPRLEIFYDPANCEPAPGPGLLEPGTGSHAVNVWDCESNGTPITRDIRVPEPSVHLNSDDPSLYDTLSAVLAPFDGGCTDEGSQLDEPYAAAIPESSRPSDGIKRSTTYVFEFVDKRGAALAPLANETFAVVLDPHNRHQIRSLVENGDVMAGPRWVGKRTSFDDIPLLRDDLGPDGARLMTFYAFGQRNVGGSSLTFPPGASGTYSVCGPFIACAEGAWWDPAHTDSPVPRASRAKFEIVVRPGQAYVARDVDCYDGEVAEGADIWASPTVLSNACPPSPSGGPLS